MSLLTGRTIGGMFLVTGSCVGAGMLALPILTGLAGFYPSFTFFIISWVFMTFTALLMIEVNSIFTQRTNIVSMASATLGPFGRFLSWSLYLFLFYTLLVAYIAAGGNIFSSFLSQLLHREIPQYWASIIFVSLFGIIIYLGTKPVDIWNRVLIAGLVLSYSGMIFLGFRKVDTTYFQYSNWKYVFAPLPVLVVSFGFHNMIPSLISYLQHDIRKAKITILGGSFLSLLIYIIWEVVILGVLPIDVIARSYQNGTEASQAISEILGTSWFTGYANAFAFFAIVTSFLAQGLCLTHFLADGFKLHPEKKHNLALCILTLAPPLFFGVLYPTVFFKALSFAGGICAVILFGIMPVLMVAISRYRKNIKASYQAFGGKIALVLALLFFLLIIFIEGIKLW